LGGVGEVVELLNGQIRCCILDTKNYQNLALTQVMRKIQ
jgi:hypothetical protein